MAYEYIVTYHAVDGGFDCYDPEIRFDDPKEFTKEIAREHFWFMSNRKVASYSVIAFEVDKDGIPV